MTKNINVEKLIDDFNRLGSVRRVAKLHNIAVSTAYRWLKKNSITFTQVIHSCNDNFFSNISPESFYWAGFIAADGNLFVKQSKYKQIRIELSIKDRSHLEKFKKCVQFSGEIKNHIDRSSCSLTITSNAMFDDLVKFNIVPQKSLTYEFPKWLSSHNLVNHFIRGVFDGVGSAFYQKGEDRNVYQVGFNIVGTKHLTDSISGVISSNIGVPKKKPRKCGSIYKIEYVGNDLGTKIRTFLYHNSTKDTRMSRKYDKIVRNSDYILALDLSLNSTGFCILKNGNLIDSLSGIIKQDQKSCIGEKLSIIDNSVKQLLRAHRPANVVIEDIFRGPNVNTFKTLAMVRGVVFSRLFEEGMDDRITVISASSARSVLGIQKTKEGAFRDIVKRHKFNYNFDEHNDLVDSIVLGLACYKMNKRGITESDLRPKKKRRKRKKRK